MLKLAQELEEMDYSIGANSTQYWLRDFIKYRQYFDNKDEEFYENLQEFLNLSFNSHWKSYLQWDNHPTNVSFVFFFLSTKIIFIFILFFIFYIQFFDKTNFKELSDNN